MGQRKVNALDPVTDAIAANNTQLIPLADPGTGVSGKMTVAQAKAVFASHKKRYIATGSEGTILTISELAGKEILSVMRGPGPLYPVDLPATPESDEYTFNGTDVGMSIATSAGESFLFIYKTPA